MSGTISRLCARGLLVLAFAVSWGADLQARPLPQLLLDTGGHLGIIRGLAFTPDGKFLVSAGDDKTIRIWDVDKGRTSRTIRGYAGPGNEGKIYALALSPDGKTLAVGGWLGPFSENGGRAAQAAHWIRLHDFATGAVTGLLKGHTDIINTLAFSPDGGRLISGSADNTAIVWDVAAQSMRAQLKEHTAFVSGAAFTPDGLRAVTASFDKTLRVWDAVTGNELRVLSGHRDHVRALAISQMDGSIASGDWRGEIKLWSGVADTPIRTAAKQQGDVPALAFSPDGKSLVAGRGPGGTYDLTVWEAATGRARAVFNGHDGNVLAVAFHPGGKIVASAGGTEHRIALWDAATGKLIKTLGGAGSRFSAAGFSGDGALLAWGTKTARESPFGRGDYEFEVGLPAGDSDFLTAPRTVTGAPAAYIRASGSEGVWTLTQAAGGPFGYGDAVLEVRRNGEVYGRIERSSSDGYRHRAYSLTPDASQVISGGGNGVLTAYDLEGKKLGDFVGHEGEIAALTVSPDGKLLVSAAADQTIRLWNVETRELILTLFTGSGGEWIAWTPQGYYASSPLGDRAGEFAVGWLVPAGVGALSDYVQAGQLKQQLFRPDIVARAIQLGSARKAIGLSEGTDFESETLIERRPPRFAVLEPADGQHLDGETAAVKIKLEEGGAPVTDLSVVVNAAQITGGGTRGLQRVRDEGLVKVIDVPLPDYENRIQIRVLSEAGQFIQDLVLYNTSRKARPETEGGKGRLFVLAIGVDTYEKRPPKDQLRFAAADAHAFVKRMTASAKGLYREVKPLVIATGGEKPPTRANIEDALATFFSETTEEDTAVLFLAGHGVLDGREYFFMPQEADAADGRWRRSTIVRWTDIQTPLQNAAGRRVLFVDTCHSERAFNPWVMNTASDSQLVVFSATDAPTLAIEDPGLGHGVFTYALLDGMSGKADYGGDGYVNVFELNLFVSQDVSRRTSGRQQPAFHSSGTDFPLAAR